MDGSHRNKALRRARVARGLTQPQLSVEAGVALCTLTLAEVHSVMSARTAKRLARALGVTPGEIAPTPPPRRDRADLLDADDR